MKKINLIIDNNDKIEGFELLKIPNTLAAIETKTRSSICSQTLEIISTAIKHLKKALDSQTIGF